MPANSNRVNFMEPYATPGIVPLRSLKSDELVTLCVVYGTCDRKYIILLRA